MAYTTIAKVQALLPEDEQIDSTRHPVYDDVTVFLVGVTGTIDVALSAGGASLPITDQPTLDWLDLLQAKETAYLIMQARGTSKEKASLWQGYHDEFAAAMEKLSDPATTSAVASSMTPSSFTMDAPDVPDSTVNPMFKRSQAHQW